MKVTVTASGRLDPGSAFFATGDVEKIVYVAAASVATAAERLRHVATVVPTGDSLAPAEVLADLARRGVNRLLVEGGTSMHTLFLTHALADELHLVVAPFLVGDPAAPRFTGPGTYPQSPTSPARLIEARPIGGCVLLRYALMERASSA